MKRLILTALALALAASPACAATLTITWPAVTFPAGGSSNHYEVERQTDGGAFVSVNANVAQGTVSITDPGLANAHAYGYRVRACNALGCGGYSPVATATPDVPSTVGTVTVTWGP